MEFAEHLTALLTEGRALAATARRAGPDAAVGSCPGWTTNDLLVHTGGVYRWVATIVGEERTEFPGRDERAAVAAVPAGADLDDWFGESLERVADALARARPGLAVPTFVPGLPPRSFWARRMAHETLVHRLDADLAAHGVVGAVDPEVAADGVDELLGFLPARVGARGGLRADPPRTVSLAADEGATWTLRLGPDGLSTHGPVDGPGVGPVDGPVDGPADGPPAGPADARWAGAAAALHAVLWNRAPWSAIAVDGDESVRELWRAEARI